MVVVRQDLARIQARLVTSRTSCQRFELFSSGLKRRKFRASRFSFMTSRRNRPMTRVASASTAPGSRHVDRVVAEIGQPQILQQQAAVGVRVRAHAALALRRELGELRAQPAALVEELLRPVALQPLSRS